MVPCAKMPNVANASKAKAVNFFIFCKFYYFEVNEVSEVYLVEQIPVFQMSK
jgi:hypothetical protein